MATIFLLCGLPGSGKTTLAKQLEVERPAVRLGEDEWVARLYPPDDAHDDDKRDAIKDIQWGIAVRVANRGHDVVLDWGVWSRSERAEYRERAATDGVQLKLIYLDVSRAELICRLAARNADLPPNTFIVTVDMLDSYLSVFEAPSPDELE